MSAKFDRVAGSWMVPPQSCCGSGRCSHALGAICHATDAINSHICRIRRRETLLEYRPLAARNDAVGNVFRIQGLILDYFRAYLRKHHFTEIITSKIVASGA